MLPYSPAAAAAWPSPAARPAPLSRKPFPTSSPLSSTTKHPSPQTSHNHHQLTLLTFMIRRTHIGVPFFMYWYADSSEVVKEMVVTAKSRILKLSPSHGSRLDRLIKKEIESCRNFHCHVAAYISPNLREDDMGAHESRSTLQQKTKRNVSISAALRRMKNIIYRKSRFRQPRVTSSVVR
ncbi:hypothetical protein ACE6H2_016512 [Prunus campanulata]